MKLTVRTNSETKDITTGFTCTPTSFTKAGEYEIKVIYGGKETTFKVTVTEDTAASPEVSATPPVSPTPSTEPQPVAKKSNALLIVGIIAGVLGTILSRKLPEKFYEKNIFQKKGGGAHCSAG